MKIFNWLKSILTKKPSLGPDLACYFDLAEKGQGITMYHYKDGTTMHISHEFADPADSDRPVQYSNFDEYISHEFLVGLDEIYSKMNIPDDFANALRNWNCRG